MVSMCFHTIKSILKLSVRIWIVNGQYRFHTIKSILKKVDNKIFDDIRACFHTIKSILKYRGLHSIYHF